MPSIAIPPKHSAVIIEADNKVHVASNVPLPALERDEFLVKTDFVAVNPSDTKMVGPFVTPGGILGTDYAGTIVALGPDVSGVEIGDRVCGAQHAMYAKTPQRGSFGEYNISAGGIWLKLPPSISSEGGATFGAGISTAGLALKLLGLPLPDEPVAKPGYVLVYGGSTATGTIAIQLLKLSGMIPIAVCSPKNADRVKSIGAETTFDYREADAAANVKTYTKNNLRFALDCITTIDSTTFCYAALGRAGGKYVSLDPFSEHAANRKTVKTDWVLGPSIFGDGSTWPEPYGRPPSDEIRAYGIKLWSVVQRLVDQGKLKHHPVRVLEGGLDKVIEGMDLVKSGQLSAEKCVVRLA